MDGPPPRSRSALSDVQRNRPPELPIHTGSTSAKGMRELAGVDGSAGGTPGQLQHAHKDAIERLVGRLVHVTMTPAQCENLQCYVYRLLGSRIGAPASGDEFQLVEKIKRNLAASGSEGARKAIRFAEVYRRFSQKRVISNRWGVMRLLSILSNSAGSGSGGRGAGSTLGLLEQSEVFKEKTAPPPMPDLASELQHALQQLDLTNPPPKVAGWRDHEAMRTDHQVPEGVLVRDVIFAMQGIDGQFIKFDKSVDGFVVQRGHGVPGPTRDLVRRICESGWLYRKVSSAVRHMTENKRSLGMVVQGLAAGLQAELSEYYRLVAVLHAQSSCDVRGLGDKLSQQQSVGHRGAVGTDDTAPQRLTLRRLVVWVQEPIARLKLMALLCDSAMGYGRALSSEIVHGLPSHAHSPHNLLKGGQLVSAMCAHARHGDPAVQDIMQRVLKPVCSPILAHIRRWIADGEIEDPYNEFFIENDSSCLDHNWEDKYKLRHDMLPSFVNISLAQRILQIGKSIHFLRRCCREMEYGQESSYSVKRIASLEYGQWDELDELVTNWADIANQALVHVLFRRYKLKQHFHAIKQFLLFGQGDFVRHLIDLLHDNVQAGTSGLLHHNLTGIVETAVRASYSQGEDSDIRERVHVSTLEASAGDDLYSVFSLEYKVDPPCNAIITPKHMSKYKRIFNFLWGLKRVEQALSSSWRRASELSHIGTHNVLSKGKDRKQHKTLQTFGLSVAYKACNMGTHHQMMHFISNMQYYMMFEVLECSWSTLVNDMQTIRDVDSLIAAHNRYVDGILEGALLNQEAEAEKAQIDTVFRCILDYCFTQQKLTEIAARQLERHGLLSREREVQETEMAWGVGGAQEAEEVRAEDLSVPADLCSHINLKAAEFGEAFGKLRDMLGKTKSADLRSLNFRLDFSEFYADLPPQPDDDDSESDK